MPLSFVILGWGIVLTENLVMSSWHRHFSKITWIQSRRRMSKPLKTYENQLHLSIQFGYINITSWSRRVKSGWLYMNFKLYILLKRRHHFIVNLGGLISLAISESVCLILSSVKPWVLIEYLSRVSWAPIFNRHHFVERILGGGWQLLYLCPKHWRLLVKALPGSCYIIGVALYIGQIWI